MHENHAGFNEEEEHRQHNHDEIVLCDTIKTVSYCAFVGHLQCYDVQWTPYCRHVDRLVVGIGVEDG